MPDRTYTIANCVDTVIVLRDPLKDFAVWKHDEFEISPTTSNEDTSTPDDHDSADTRTSPLLVMTPEQANVTEGIAAIKFEDTGRGEVSLFNPRSTLKDEIEPLPAPTEGIHYLCSSGNLKEAFKNFRNSLSSLWTESRARDDGRHYIIVEEWDEDALLVQLNIMHLRHKQVPKQIDLEKLAMIAVLVDYFRCHEAVDLYQPLWIRNLIGGRTSIKRKHKIKPVYDRYAQNVKLTLIDCILEGRDKALQLLAQALTEQLDSLANDPDLCNDSPFFRNLNCRLKIIEEVKEDLACYGVNPQAAQPFEGRSVKDALGIFQGMQQAYKHSCGGGRKTRLDFGITAEDIRGVSLFDCYSEEESEDYHDLAEGWYPERDV